MYLLDTNVLLWFRTEDEKLPSDILAMLKDPNHLVYYSVINSWELSIKQGKGKLPLSEDFFVSLPRIGFDCLTVEEKHIDTLRALPKLHGDPFDRMLVAQAKAENMTLVTSDKELAAYPIKTLLL